MLTFASSLLRITLLRGSPERILYDRVLMIGGLLGALVVSALTQWFFFGDHAVFVILRVFAELTMFMLWVVLLTAKVARLRLASAMLCMVWMSLVGDSLLLLLTPLVHAQYAISPQQVGWLVAALVAYGAANVAGWALRKPLLPVGLLHVALYGAAVTGLDLVFRELYNMMAA